MINDEQEVEVQDDDLETTSEEVEEETEEQDVEYWKAEALKNKAILDRNKNKPKKETKSKQSDEFDYGEYAFLAQKGIESDDDIAFVRESMKDSGKSLRDTLNASWFKAELTERQALAKTTDAVPKGKGASGTAIDSVEYWMSKPISEVPQEMRSKVVNARVAKETNTGVFYNS